MAGVGIIVNPFAGKDLRRLTSRAETVSHQAKIQKVLRMVGCIRRLGVERVLLMPDTYGLNATIADRVNETDSDRIHAEVLSFHATDDFQDTVRAARMMREESMDCIVVLGGDGTHRLVAAADADLPILPVSTGTNNVYPTAWEGTTVGVAAAYFTLAGAKHCSVHQDKRVEIYINGSFCDIALVEAALTRIPYVGSKVVTEIRELTDVVVCRSSPDAIGFSSMVGTLRICRPEDEYGYRVKISPDGIRYLSPVCSGGLLSISYSELERLEIGAPYTCVPDYDGTVALDGERTVVFRAGDEVRFVVTRDGPRRLDIARTLMTAVERGFFLDQALVGCAG